MKAAEWWKNFALGIELDASGMFIYNGLKAFDSLYNIYYTGDIFEIIYNLSVGIERLYKVAIILFEHNDNINVEELERSLITHSTIDLANRLNSHQSLNYSGIHKEFLSILSKFYKSYRYGRFSLASIPNIEPEKKYFIEFFQKYLVIENNDADDLLLINSNQIKSFLGKILKRITRPVFKLIQNKARELNIYTDELRSDSKAIKIFLEDKLDFIDENRIKKELIIFLINKETSGAHINFFKNLKSLRLDAELAPNHIKALLNDNYLPYVKEEVCEAYSEVEEINKRLCLLDLIDDENLSLGDPEDLFEEYP